MVAAFGLGGSAALPGTLRAQDAGILRTQHLQDVLVPPGQVRFGFAPSFSSWDKRYGRRREEDGALVEEDEPLGMDLTDPLGTSLFSGTDAMRDALRGVLDDPGYTPALGAVRATISKDVTRMDFSLDVGVTDWLTVGMTVPWVQTRTAVDISFRPTSGTDLGVNPLFSDNSGVSELLNQMDAAAVAAEARGMAECDADPSSEACRGADALAARTRGFSDRMRGAYLASILFPLDGSEAATALEERAAGLAGDLAAAGLPTFGAPRFSTDSVDARRFAGLPADPAAGIRTTPLASIEPPWSAGDVELSAAARLWEGEVRDSGASAPRLSWRVDGGLLLRLGTGDPDNPDVLLDVGTGDGQTDVEAFAFGVVRSGERLGLRALLRYGVQRSTTLVRRVAPPELVLASFATRRQVRWSPGDYYDVTLSPRWHLSESLAVAADYHRFHKGSDSFRIVTTPEDGTGLDASVLERETEQTFEELALGLRLNTMALRRRGVGAPPIEFSVRAVFPAGGSGGQTPRARRVDMNLRLLHGLWGG